MPRLFPLLLAFALLSACAVTPEAPPASTADTADRGPAPPPEPAERAFPEDSIYPLLVAEFALRRGVYTTALANYMQQARILEDAGVARHTSHLARYLQDEKQALEATQLWLRQEPDSLEANHTAATLLSQQGRPLEALPHMAAVARSGHEANFPMLLQGYSALPAEQQAEFARQLLALSGEFPGDTGLLLTQAMTLAERGQFDAARAKLDELFAAKPMQEQGLLLEAKIRLQQQSPDPFGRIEQALDENPDNSRLRLEYARLLTSVNLPAARKQFEILSAQSPDDADLLLALALINREVGDDLIARAYLKQVLDTGRRQNEAHFYLGQIEENADRNPEALDHYRQVGDSRQYLAATQRIAEILISQGELPELQDWFRKQRAAQPGRGEQLYALQAETLSSAGAEDVAMATLEAGIADHPNSTSLRYARSLISQQRGDLAAMEADLRAILRMEPDNATALNALGYTLADQTERYAEAEELIARALMLQPDEPAILDSMGWVLYRQGRLEEALDYLQRAYAGFPDPEVAAHLGEVLWVSDRRQEALRLWQGAFIEAPQHRVLRATLQRLGVDPAQLAQPLPDALPPAK